MAPDASDPSVAATYCATLVDQWVACGLRHAVVSPGSRSTPLALAVASDERLTTHVHHDERAASFMALGIGIATRTPALVVTTSGTATTELHSAVVEAHQAAVPMIVCTADRPPELQGVGAPQTIDQTELFGDAVRWFVDPGPPRPEHDVGWRHLAADAVAAATGDVVGRAPGPVHLNLAFREPLVGEPGVLPPPIPADERPDARWGVPDEQLAALARTVGGRKVLVVAGDRAARTAGERSLLLELFAALGWPVLADHLSGLRVDDPAVVIGADAFLRDRDLADALRPEVVVHLGGLLASRVVNEWSASSGGVHVGVDRWGMVPDPGGVVGDRHVVDVATFARQLLAAAPGVAPVEWTAAWRRASVAASTAVSTGAAGEIAAMRAAVAAVPSGGSLVVSSSMPVRDLEWYGPPRDDIAVFANRGANGIDGVASTGVGVALGAAAPTVCVLGDVAFLHDSNALLGLAARAAAVCLVVIDNDGGGIFSFLPQADLLDGDRFEQLFGTPHGVDLALLASSHGVGVTTAPDGEVLAEVLERWAQRPRPMVVHVRSDRARNVADHRALNDAIATLVRDALVRDGRPGTTSA